jgi:hypothetical protein
MLFFAQVRAIHTTVGRTVKKSSVPTALNLLVLMQCNLHDAQFFGFFLLQLRLCQKDVV